MKTDYRVVVEHKIDLSGEVFILGMFLLFSAIVLSGQCSSKAPDCAEQTTEVGE